MVIGVLVESSASMHRDEMATPIHKSSILELQLKIAVWSVLATDITKILNITQPPLFPFYPPFSLIILNFIKARSM